YRAAGEDVQVRQFGDTLDCVLQARGASEYCSQAELAGEAEAVVDAGPAEVGVDEQDAGIALGHHGGEVCGCRGLAFRWCSAGEEDELGRLSSGGEQQRSLKRAEGLRELGLGLRKHGNIALRRG